MSQLAGIRSNTDRAIPSHLESQLVEVGNTLVAALGRVVEALPGGPFRPQELARRLSLNKDLTNRLHRALRAHDPLAALSILPGPAPLRQFLEAASTRVDAAGLFAEAHDAVSAFDRLVRAEFGDRGGLEAVISANMPATRERFEATAKQEMHRAVARLKGVMAETSLVTFLGHPSATRPDCCDTAMLGGYVGLRRIRPGAPIQFTSVLDESWPNRSMLNESAGGKSVGPLLTQFCQPRDVPLRADTEGDRVRYSVTGDTVGSGAAMNVFLAEFYPANNPLLAEREDQRKRWFYATIEQPSAVQVLDVLLHKSMWPDAPLELRLHDTVVNGTIKPNDRSRECDRLDLLESVQELGVGRSRFRCDDVPQYLDMLDHVAGRSGWNLDEFRGYRCRIAYPFYGSQVSMIFRVPWHPNLASTDEPPREA